MAHRHYSASQRAEATGMVLQHGRPAAAVAREMSVSVTTVHRWISDALASGVRPAANAGPITLPGPATSPPREDLESRMRDAIQRLGTLETQLQQLLRRTECPTITCGEQGSAPALS